MINKNNFKKMYEKKINKEKNYQNIMNKIEKGENKVKYFKLAFIPLCVLLICGFVSLKGNGNILKETLNKNQESNKIKDSIKINEVSEYMGALRIDGKFEPVTNYFNIPYYEVFANLDIPNGFTENNYMLFVKSNTDGNNYDKLRQYTKAFTKGNKHIDINYFDLDKPVRDYLFEEGKTSVINNLELTIYKYEELLFASFKYNNLFIDIETYNVSEKEFINLLKSIIK